LITKPSILIAIPCYGGILYDTCVSGLFNLSKNFERSNIKNELLLVSNESLISTGRSNIANMFLHDTKHDYLMCIDADVGFEWYDIITLLEHEKEFVTAPYSMKVIPPQYNFAVSKPVVWENDLIKVDHIGTGFQLVHREVFTKISNKYPELKYTPSEKHRPVSQKMKESSYHYYETMIDGGIIPEDISFCRRYNSTGGSIWLDTTINLTHNGSHVFTGYDDLKTTLQQQLGNNNAINSNSNSMLRRDHVSQNSSGPLWFGKGTQ
jgi:hypothetical protein